MEEKNCVFVEKSEPQAQSEVKKISLIILYIISRDLYSRKWNGHGVLAVVRREEHLNGMYSLTVVCRCCQDVRTMDEMAVLQIQ